MLFVSRKKSRNGATRFNVCKRTGTHTHTHTHTRADEGMRCVSVCACLSCLLHGPECLEWAKKASACGLVWATNLHDDVDIIVCFDVVQANHSCTAQRSGNSTTMSSPHKRIPTAFSQRQHTTQQTNTHTTNRHTTHTHTHTQLAWKVACAVESA